MDSQQLRERFLRYFADRQHTIVPSSSLVPKNDPSLLFTNAGMVPFKDVFLGNEQRAYQRAASIQRCVRAGGKHNDLENVGYTARHHTFFEMLGNFSFGDYFKREAIHYAWDFLTQELGVSPQKLWVTVYREDDAAAQIWLDEIKIDPARFSRCDEKDNFWSMGDTGPCGPCSEIFYDHGPAIPGGPPGSADANGDRYVEIWNLVFMQYQRDKEGQLTPLPKPAVDTGMGLERLAAVLQGVTSNYDIDTLQHLIHHAARLTDTQDLHAPSLKVLADHIRSSVFLILDGVIPSNDGRGYVLRRIIRRALRHAHKLGYEEVFFHKLLPPLCETMSEAYPELLTQQAFIAEVLKQEENQFARTLSQGMRIFAQDIETLTGSEIPGDILFKLYDTYGFPLDLTADIAREKQLTCDVAGFERLMAQQKNQSQQASQFHSKQNEIAGDISSEFVGYREITTESSIVTLLQNEQRVNSLNNAEPAAVVLHTTPFYAESGGQVGDTGFIMTDAGKFQVEDTQKVQHATLHFGRLVHGALHVGDAVTATVDEQRRTRIKLNHSATHLLHAALRHYLGTHVLQKGSLVAPDRLRFDFTHHSALAEHDIRAISRLVNEKIRANLPCQTRVMSPDAAQRAGAIALFGEKYGSEVRVLSMGDFSIELCGGTHVQATGEIGFFKIIQETGIAAGIRRIEAVSGETAEAYCDELSAEIKQLEHIVKAEPGAVLDKVTALYRKLRDTEKALEKTQRQMIRQGSHDQLTQHRVADIDIVIHRLQEVDMKTIRQSLDELKNRYSRAVLVVLNETADKLQVVCGITKNLLGQGIDPKALVTELCGKGGGRDDMAQGGGIRPSNLAAKLEAIPDQVAAALKTSST